MVGVVVIAAAGFVGMLVLYGLACANAKAGAAGKGSGGLEECNPKKYGLAAVFVLAFLVRLFAAAVYRGHESDMNLFLAWEDRIFSEGIPNFYLSDSFSDYPPGYMYILYVMGGIRSLLHLSASSVVSVVLTKMPAILADLGTGWLVYKVAIKKFCAKGAAALAAAYMFCPLVLLDSAVWGQADGVFTFFVVLMCWLITEKKLIPSYFVFAAAVLVKPQSLMYTPVLIFGIMDQVILSNFRWNRFFRHLGLGLLAVAMIAFLMVPFHFDLALAQYVETLGSYEYATVNAYNFWAMRGLNWVSQDGIWLGITYKTWGTIAIILTVLAAAWFNFRCKKTEGKYYYLGGFIITCVFTFSVRMHERYIFPAMAFLILAFAARPKKELFYLYEAAAFVGFLNVAHVLFLANAQNESQSSLVRYVISYLMLLVFVYMVYIAVRFFNKPARTEEEEEALGKQAEIFAAYFASEEKREKEWIRPSAPKVKMTRTDYILMGIITGVYAVIAFINLGGMTVPETEYSFESQGAVALDFGQDVYLGQMQEYLGYQDNLKYYVEYSSDNENWGTLYGADNPMDAGSVFRWNDIGMNITCRYLKILPAKDTYHDSILELVFIDGAGEMITPVNAGDYEALFDEQDKFQPRSNLNGTYFDEIYHARTAYEMIHGLYCYENTHPPLGKLIMSLGIRIFGMCPFGWRFMGNLFGILMVPAMYVFSKKFFKETWISGVVTVLFTFDFMHFAQTRIATIDVFVTLFIILSYYFMYCYSQYSFYDTKLSRTFIPLSLGGTAMGLGWASKWTGMYASAGLAVIFFVLLGRRYREYAYAAKEPEKKTAGIEHGHILECFKKNSLYTLGFCCIFFVAVPVIIYLLSYIPFHDGTDREFLEKVVEAQKTMYNYHQNAALPHPYFSKWWQWPVMYRPVLYYIRIVSDTVREGISAFGNPMVWWGSIPAFFFMIYRMFAKRDRQAAFLVAAFLSQYLPWLLVRRGTFIYHYFPSVPFITLMLGYSLYLICKNHPSGKKWVFVYAGLAVGMFVMFYPVLSGMPVSLDYADHWLKWFSSWELL